MAPSPGSASSSQRRSSASCAGRRRELNDLSGEADDARGVACDMETHLSPAQAFGPATAELVTCPTSEDGQSNARAAEPTVEVVHPLEQPVRPALLVRARQQVATRQPLRRQLVDDAGCGCVDDPPTGAPQLADEPCVVRDELRAAARTERRVEAADREQVGAGDREVRGEQVLAVVRQLQLLVAQRERRDVTADPGLAET